MKKVTIEETARWLMERDGFLILTHARPDGDTLGSAAALAAGLGKMGKRAALLYNSETTKKFSDMMGGYFGGDDFEYSHVVSVDIASLELLPDNAGELSGSIELAIDHHPSNTGFAENLCLDAGAAACGEIVFRLLTEMGAEITGDAADLLYVAISTDTGCFAYANTTADTLETAGRIVRLGARNAELNKILFRTKSRERILLESSVISGIKFYREGRVAIAGVSRKLIEECRVTENELDDIAAIPGVIEGVKVGVTIKEQTGGMCKISVRTTSDVSANRICAVFGGGGHAMAAGCSIKGSIETAREKIREAIDSEMSAEAV